MPDAAALVAVVLILVIIDLFFTLKLMSEQTYMSETIDRIYAEIKALQHSQREDDEYYNDLQGGF